VSTRRIRENSLQFLGGQKSHDAQLFRDALPARKLKVLIDIDVWDRLSTEQIPFDATLYGLLLDERVAMSRYSDDGPPPDAARLEADGFLRGDEAIGWTTLAPSDDGMVAYSITTATTTAVERRALLTDQVLLPRWVLTNENGTADEADALLIATAHEIGADVLVTQREPVLNTEIEDRGNCRFVSPADALPLIALYLRAAGEYVLAKSSNFMGTTYRRGFYDRAAARCIPSLTQFVHRAEPQVSAARLLTVLRRARAVLEARDRLALLVSEPLTEDVIDAVEGVFTHAVVDMVAFHDILAHVVNELLPQPETDAFRIKWQKEPWRRRALDGVPALCEGWRDGGRAIALNSALRAVRNEIHDAAPLAAPLRTRWGPAEVGLAFHEQVGTTVLDALRKLECDSDPGVGRAFADGHVIRPLVFVEFVLPWVFTSVETTLAALLPRLPEREPPVRDPVLDSAPVGQAVDAIVHLRRPTCAL
jgi:hypothetical protein